MEKLNVLFASDIPTSPAKEMQIACRQLARLAESTLKNPTLSINARINETLHLTDEQLRHQFSLPDSLPKSKPAAPASSQSHYKRVKYKKVAHEETGEANKATPSVKANSTYADLMKRSLAHRSRSLDNKQRLEEMKQLSKSNEQQTAAIQQSSPTLTPAPSPTGSQQNTPENSPEIPARNNRNRR